jgi:hypothetical protein
MAKYDYSKLAKTATRLINRFGKTLQKRTVTNSGSEWNPIQTIIDTPIDGVIGAYGIHEIDNTLIMSSDKKLLTTSLLELDDKVMDDNSVVYAIVSINQVQPADTTLLYKVQLRL